jgi:hypothetical protein
MARPPGLAGRRPLVRRPAPRQAARRDLLGKFGGKAGEPEAKKEPGTTPAKPGQKPTTPSEGFVPLSKLGKKPEAPAKPGQAKETPKKPTSAAFEKLKELSETYKKKGAKKGEGKENK